MVLRRPNVKAAFVKHRPPIASAFEKQEPMGPAKGKFASFFRSLAGYMLPTSVRKGFPQPGVTAPETKEHEAPLPAKDPVPRI